MQLNVTSEIGRLKSVLVHLPGREIDVMIPPMMNQLLFDDILYGQVAREEHRRFQQLIRFIAPEVLDIQDLLEEVLESDELKRLVVRDLEKRKLLGRKLAAALREQPAALLAQTLIGGIPHERDGKGELPSFDLLPVPNYFFMRDPQVVIGDGVVVCGMATQARSRESLLSGYVFAHHPLFRESRRWSDFTAGTAPGREHKRMPTIEGGDILVPSRDLLLVGVTERTNRAGVRQLATSLREAGSEVRTIIVVELPRQRSFMHLDTVFTFTSRNECLIYPPVILPGGSQAATVTTIDLTKKGISYSPQKSLLAALKKRGFDLDPIYCGGRSAVDQQREQWTDGANAFTLAPGIILLYERNVRTAEELAAHGYHIVYEDDLLLGRTELETWTDTKYAIQMAGHELSRARGGPRCMTMPLVREDV
ncbi:MAG TPA: arginine deiminase family protein [Thermoanaerobaculia bacterium]|jgi:arginine deiminase|nr:arginine deiminase family protein [Thermoanaerobaculia bacterium]